MKDFREMTKEEKEEIFDKGVQRALKENHNAEKSAIQGNEKERSALPKEN